MGFLHGVRAYALEEWVAVGNPRLIDHVPGGQTDSIPRLISGSRVVGFGSVGSRSSGCADHCLGWGWHRGFIGTLWVSSVLV